MTYFTYLHARRTLKELGRGGVELPRRRQSDESSRRSHDSLAQLLQNDDIQDADNASLSNIRGNAYNLETWFPRKCESDLHLLQIRPCPKHPFWTLKTTGK